MRLRFTCIAWAIQDIIEKGKGSCGEREEEEEEEKENKFNTIHF